MAPNRVQSSLVLEKVRDTVGVDKECLRGCVNHLLDNFPLDCIIKDVIDVLKIRVATTKRIHEDSWRDMSLFIFKYENDIRALERSSADVVMVIDEGEPNE